MNSQQLYKPSDILIHELGYRDCSKAYWFKKFKQNNDSSFWIDGMLTEQGRQYCITKCNRRKQKALDENAGVYVIQYPWDLKRVKIGWSDNVFKRYKQYNTILCGEQKLLLHIKTTDPEEEQRVFNKAEEYGLKRQDPYEVFHYDNVKQLQKFIESLK